MGSRSTAGGWRARSFLLAVVALAAVACNTVGPRVLRTARQPYNEALAASRDQEILLNLLRMAEGKKPHFLKFDNVVTTYRLNASAGLGVSLGEATVTSGGDGARADTETEGVSAEVGAEWQETPVVTYKPLTGEDFAKRLMAPVSLENLALLFEAGYDGELLVELFVSRAGIFFEDDPRLAHLAEIIGLLQENHHLQFLPVGAGKPEQAPRLFIVLRRYDRTRDDRVDSRETCEFACLLPFSDCEGGYRRFCGDRRSLATREYRDSIQDLESTQEFIRVDARSLQERARRKAPKRNEDGEREEEPEADERVPPKAPLISTRPLAGAIRQALGLERRSSGLDLAASCSRGEPLGAHLRILCGEDKPGPEEAFLAARYLGRWFWIPATGPDAARSRQAYLLLALVYTMQATEPQVSRAPDIVIPVGGG